MQNISFSSLGEVKDKDLQTKIKKQLELEEESITLGVKRYRDKLQEAREKGKI
ncbi:hypothetical protein KFV02_00780 [Desulfohalobiaceae bacterium Ax17]|uniref:hypothetical protein n=1 Tax=Desulfovulcanus ferrireducens TaxID=2831190 RepID=UPI00207BB010|nr:hypothetical protein [Desulfovulcanus ferrireducens]MBT8762466.1 hypothetical protein [Desulfovulcanus ferrireducens]